MIEERVEKVDFDVEKGENIINQKTHLYGVRKMNSLREKITIILMVLVIAFLCIKTINITSKIVEKNNENTALTKTLNKEAQLVKDLRDEVNKTTTSNEIMRRAEEVGLRLNEENVKVVE